MKMTWRMIFTSFKKSYPELCRRGMSYQPYGQMTIRVMIPGVGKILYDCEKDDITWIERWRDEEEEKRLAIERRPSMYEHFVETIINYMDENQMTHQEFADMVGISRISISKYLNGRSIPKVSTMLEICEKINIDI